MVVVGLCNWSIQGVGNGDSLVLENFKKVCFKNQSFFFFLNHHVLAVLKMLTIKHVVSPSGQVFP